MQPLKILKLSQISADRFESGILFFFFYSFLYGVNYCSAHSVRKGKSTPTALLQTKFLPWKQQRIFSDVFPKKVSQKDLNMAFLFCQKNSSFKFCDNNAFFMHCKCYAITWSIDKICPLRAPSPTSGPNRLIKGQQFFANSFQLLLEIENLLNQEIL